MSESVKSAEYVFDVPSSAWLTANHRLNHWDKARRTKVLVSMGQIMGLQWPRKRFTERVRVHVVIHPRVNSNFDPLNVEPTVKGLLDGLVRAGVLIDDSWRYVEGPDLRRGQPIRTLQTGIHRVVMTLTAVGEVITE